MKGPDGARDALALALSDILPVKIPLLREAFGLDEGELPDVDTITSGEKPDQALTSAGNTWIEVVTPRMSSMKVVDITSEGDQEFRCSYSARIYVWSLGQSWTDALDRRDRIAGGVRAGLLEFPTLTLAGGDTGCRVEYDGWTEEYGVPVRPSNPSGRCWATAMLAFELISFETLAQGRMRPPIGQNQRTAISTKTYGMEPMPDDTPTPGTPIVADPVPTP